MSLRGARRRAAPRGREPGSRRGRAGPGAARASRRAPASAEPTRELVGAARRHDGAAGSARRTSRSTSLRPRSRTSPSVGCAWFLTSVGGDGVALGSGLGRHIRPRPRRRAARGPTRACSRPRSMPDGGDWACTPGWVTDRTRREAHDMVARYVSYRELGREGVGASRGRDRSSASGWAGPSSLGASTASSATAEGGCASSTSRPARASQQGRARAARPARRLPGGGRGRRLRRSLGQRERWGGTRLHRQGRAWPGCGPRSRPSGACLQSADEPGGRAARRGHAEGWGRELRRVPREVPHLPREASCPVQPGGRCPVSITSTGRRDSRPAEPPRARRTLPRMRWPLQRARGRQRARGALLRAWAQMHGTRSPPLDIARALISRLPRSSRPP